MFYSIRMFAPNIFQGNMSAPPFCLYISHAPGTQIPKAGAWFVCFRARATGFIRKQLLPACLRRNKRPNISHKRHNKPSFQQNIKISNSAEKKTPAFYITLPHPFKPRSPLPSPPSIPSHLRQAPRSGQYCTCFDLATRPGRAL